MKPDLAKIRKVTEATTPGKWIWADKFCLLAPELDVAILDHSSHLENGAAWDVDPANAEFIAGARETVLALLDELKKFSADNNANNEKWRHYEKDYILPMFGLAKGVGIDLQQMVHDNPGKNSSVLLAEHLIDELEGVNESAEDEECAHRESLDWIERLREQVTKLEKIIADQKIDHDALLEEHTLVLGQRDRLRARVDELGRMQDWS